MLHITGSMKTLKQELLSARDHIEDILIILNRVKPDTDLSKTVGLFITNLPEYKVLAKDAETAKQVLRKVCSTELNPSEAAKKFYSALEEINALIKLLE